jgi:hypothetical protein
MGTSGAPLPAAPDELLPKRHLPSSFSLRGGLSMAAHQEAAGKDQEAAKVVFIEATDPAEQVSVESHLGYERTQGLQRPLGSWPGRLEGWSPGYRSAATRTEG